jgi:two-component system, NtrC family, sensor kinase
MTCFFRFVCLLASIMFFWCSSLRGSELVLTQTAQNTFVKNQVDFLKDSIGNLEINGVMKSNAFQQIPSDIPNFGISHAPYWFKLNINNQTNSTRFLLQISQAGLDEVEFYQSDSSGNLTVLKTGEDYVFDSRTYFDPNYIFRVHLPTGKTSSVFIRVKARDNVQVPMLIGLPETIFQTNKQKDTIVGIYIGIMLVMLFYNFFIYFTVRDRSYLLYVIYIAAVILTQASIHGYTFQYLWPNIPVLAYFSSFIFPPFVGITSFYFMREFLHTKNALPRIDKYHPIFIVGYLIGFLLAIFQQFETSFLLIEICAVSLSMYMLAQSIILSRRGSRPARIFLIAWIIFLFGVTLYVMKDIGILPYNNFTLYTMPIGSALEVVLLSFALADRIKLLKKEKEISQAEAFSALQENEKLIREQNIILEQKVQERTTELEKTNDDLNKTLTHLKETQAQLVDAEKMASLGQLTAGIAHEINNPINFVHANIKPLKMDIADLMILFEKYDRLEEGQNLKEGLLEIENYKKEIDLAYLRKEIENLLNGIEDGANRTAEIVSGLKSFSRLDESDLKDANINEGIESTLTILRSAIPPNVEVVKNLGLVQSIECFPGKLNQVFMNVLNNAFQAIEQKKSENKEQVTITTKNVGDTVEVLIEDTGIGMSPEVKAKIFEPFFTTKDVGQGTGLGMSIVFKIIESHSAKIQIGSEVGKGTSVLITLSRKQNIKPSPVK